MYDKILIFFNLLHDYVLYIIKEQGYEISDNIIF